MHSFATIAFLLFLSTGKETLSSECSRRNYGYSSFVCVCDDTYCNFDGVSNSTIDTSNVKVIKSSRDDFRNSEEILPRQDGTFNSSDVDFSIYVNPDDRRQEIIGFGGAFTDAASINIKSLTQEAQNNLMKMYFAKEGSRYNLARIPIAGCDFSTHPYSYDDVEGDVDLAYFNLTVEDYEYKLPLIRRAIGLCPDDLFILTTPWSPPAWMKTNGKFNESGELLPEMWQPFSNYLVKFFQMYEENLGVELWGFTPQNEPLGGFIPTWSFNTCGWTAEDMRDWIATVLGPTVSAAGYRRLKLLIHDFNLNTLSEYITPILEDPIAIEYIDGIAVHWYSDTYMSTDVLDGAHDMANGRFILYTEACIDSVLNFVELGNWERGEQYITDIIQDSNHWSTGWIDWNLALDLQGGPNWVSNFVDSSIIVNTTANEFYVQPLYYAISLFSRNVERGATSISSSFDPPSEDLSVTAFENPNGQIVVIVANTAETPFQIGIVNEYEEYIFKYNIEGKTWLSITYEK
ncbi:UNVERIFIED_CONTAM: hypothetical protein RMT77_016361 [Armadillidium vulgare]